MSWGKKKKHASQNTIPAAEFRQEGESALFEKAPKEPPKPAPGEYLDNPLPVPKRHVRKEMNYAFEPQRYILSADFQQLIRSTPGFFAADNPIRPP